MSKFEYVVFEGWDKLKLYAFKSKETSRIKQIKADKTQGPNTKSLNIMGQQGWELISTPLMGPQRLIFKKKFKIIEFILIYTSQLKPVPTYNHKINIS